jgi:hypothetical protein
MSEIADIGTLSIPEIKAVLATGVLTTKSFDYLEKKGWLRAFAQGLLGVALDGTVVWLPQDANGAKPISDVVYGPNSSTVATNTTNISTNTHNWIPTGAVAPVAIASRTQLLTNTEYGLIILHMSVNGTISIMNADAAPANNNQIASITAASGGLVITPAVIGPIKGPVWGSGPANSQVGVQKVLVV